MFHIPGRISNLYERFCLNLYSWLSNHMRFVIVEGDTSTPDEDVTNSAVTVSSRLADDIVQCPPNSDGECMIMLFRLGRQFGFEANPDLSYCLDDDGEHYPPMSPLQYSPKFRTIGFQPLAPDVTAMLHTWHLPTNGHAVLPVSRHNSRITDSAYYLIDNPGGHLWWFRPIAAFIWHMAFRYADSRFKG